MKYFSTFSGIGGFELGIQQAYELQKIGIKSEDSTDTKVGTSQYGERPLCVGYSEIDKYAIQIYEKHFNHKQYGDITKINADELPDFDLLVGGFPCQAFSIAGKRRGFEDTRGTLFFELARILQAKRPRLFLFENVKGLLSHDNGQTFRTIISTLDDLGYDLQWQVLNSKNHGVPQNRERVFIVGHLRGTPRPEVFPFGGGDGDSYEGDKKGEEQISDTITARYHSRNGRGTHISIGTLRTHNDGKGFREIESGVCPTIPARAREDGSGQPIVVIPVLTPDRLIKRQNGRRFKEDGDESFTLTSQDRHGISDGVSIRRLTPTECERLQGFPDGWTEGVSDSQRYKCLGNAVTVNVVRDIMERLLSTQ